jgi:hypothetical protein
VRKAWTASVLAGLVVGALAPAAIAAPGKGFKAVEIHGERVAPGLELNAHVFYARPPRAPYACEDINTSTAQPESFASPNQNGIAFSRADNVPNDWGSPLAASFATWNTPLLGSTYFTMPGSVAAVARPSKFSDGTNYIGLAKIQGSALAVAYTWSDRFTGRITEADVYFNSRYSWAVASPTSTCPNGSAYDIESIATHELGHVIGLDHINVLAATLYQSAPAGETRKRTLTVGEVNKASSLL